MYTRNPPGAHNPLLTHQILLRNWNDEIFQTILESSRSYLSITGDTANRLVLHPAGAVHFTHMTQSASCYSKTA
jgi:hypothetical protein